ncbi:MAG: class I SAM-dependent methyltransferase, partial [Candidatus Zixiibacteriota bacterium]
LEVGCGPGVVLEFFAQQGFTVEGIDLSPEAVAMVDRRGYSASVCDLECDDIAGGYDVILCLEVLQQVHDPVSVLIKLKQALAADGELIVSLPNEFHLISRLQLMIGNSHLGKFTHSHLRLFSPERDRELFARAGLEIACKKHLSIVPPRLRWLARLSRPFAVWLPSSFALSSLYRVRAK